MRMPFDGIFVRTQEWNDERYRSSYALFGILGHNGQDYGLPIGTRILAPHGGKVIEAELDQYGYGWYVKIEDDDQGSVLAHLSKMSVKVGDQVVEGTEVGLSGNSGNSTGPHLHWGYYRKPRHRANGFLGYIDQTDWMNIRTVNDVGSFQKRIEELTLKIMKARADLA
jgi:murein DD-endopeptidase MepM/ murein hydrolase activator NlpD